MANNIDPQHNIKPSDKARSNKEDMSQKTGCNTAEKEKAFQGLSYENMSHHIMPASQKHGTNF